MLSAGEENRAERILLFSQLQLEPKHKALNVLFLDEIEGHLDRAGRTMFTEVVIPKLKETFKDKSIILISHEESLKESPEINHLWLAQRKDRVTTLQVIENYNRK
jgi:DNA repair exonuclease SbcCD ATPase subunit